METESLFDLILNAKEKLNQEFDKKVDEYVKKIDKKYKENGVKTYVHEILENRKIEDDKYADNELKSYNIELIDKKENKEIRIDDDFYLNRGYFLVTFMDIPCNLVQRVDFIEDKKLTITYRESSKFSIETFFKRNSDIIHGQNLTIQYLNKKGSVIRTDKYIVSRICDINKSSLDVECTGPMEITIMFNCITHDISTCKE